jgi:hypothetical protein
MLPRLPNPRSYVQQTVAIALALGVAACATIPLVPSSTRPPQIAGEWVDVAKSTPTDTSLWLLRADGYDGSAHIRVTIDSMGMAHASRTESKYGSWYMTGTLGDSLHESICFSKRVGRFGASCIAFAMDTVGSVAGPLPRLKLHNYRGMHHIADRLLVARRTGGA